MQHRRMEVVVTCVCACVCMCGYPCAYAWVEFNHCMRLCSWCHFWLKEVKESLHHVPLGATQEFLIKAIVSKLHKLHCREQERVCAARLCIYSEVLASVYSAPWYTVLFFHFVFFLAALFTLSHLLSSLLWIVTVMIIKGTWLKVPDKKKKYNKISFRCILLLNGGLVLLV